MVCHTLNKTPKLAEALSRIHAHEPLASIIQDFKYHIIVIAGRKKQMAKTNF